jgi:hypothetical protein
VVRIARLTETEKQFSDRVVDLAHLTGWRVMHIHPASVRNGRPITPAGADGKGYPDLTLVRERLVFAELKVGSNKPTPEQEDWARWLTAAGAEVYLWKPGDWDQITAVLGRIRVPAVMTDPV